MDAALCQQSAGGSQVTYILARLKEASTWRGLAVLFGAVGVHVAPDLLPSIGVAVTGVIGAVEVIRREIK
jgi:spore maturation protein SpmB